MPILKKLHFCSYLVTRETLKSPSKAICVSKALEQLWKQEIDAPLSQNAKVAIICQFHDAFLMVGVTKYKYCKLQ